MLTTLGSYRLITNNLTRSLATAASQPQVARETEYYKAHIGDVNSVDDFLDDQRLFAYAMKAYGLEDMTYAKAFMRKVLESDLDDDKSFVNKLTDKRYLEFAKAFHFLPSGGVDVGATTAQDSASEDAMIGLYSQQRIGKGDAAATEADYYRAQIGNITSVDQLLSDQRLFDYVLTAHGINAKYASVSAIRNVLTSDLSDPNSVANLYGEQYQALAAAFSFETDGSVAAGGSAQTPDQTSQTMLAYYEATGTGESPAAATFKTDYFNELMAGITNVDDLVNNEFLHAYVATAAGLDPILTTPATVREILVSDLSDPDSAANQSDALKAVAQAFNFNTDGSLDSGVAAQDPDQAATLNNLFLTNYDDDAVASEQTSTSYYRSTIGYVLHVDNLLNDPKLYNYVLTSYGIDPGEVTKAKVKQILLSDPTSATSYASLLHDPRFTALASAFNFDSGGYTQGVKQAQTTTAEDNTVSRYTDAIGDLTYDQKQGEIESAYYREKMSTIGSVDELVKDQRLRAYIVKAYGLDKDVTNDTLRKVLTSDLLDQDSFVNKSNDTSLKALAADFNFNTDGTVARAAVGVAQDKAELITTQNLYIRQTMEQNAGENNEGVRLALYFQRKASSIDSAYDILADKALLQVVQTALRLPESMSLLDIEKQADLITKRLDLKDLQDPDKVEQFLTTFTNLWEIDNPTSPELSPALLITQPAEANISYDLLAGLQNLKLGGF